MGWRTDDSEERYAVEGTLSEAASSLGRCRTANSSLTSSSTYTQRHQTFRRAESDNRRSAYAAVTLEVASFHSTDVFVAQTWLAYQLLHFLAARTTQLIARIRLPSSF